MRETGVALIMAGGRGKRMDILSYLRPKPALPFAGGFRVIDFSLSNCIHSQINDIAILTDYQRSSMANYLRQWNSANIPLKELDILEPENGSYKGNADAVYQNLHYLETRGSDTVLILAGDHVYKMDYRKMIAFHHMVKADATVGVVRVPIEETFRFGTVTLDADKRIKEFQEKSSRSQSNLVSMGIYVFNKDLLARRLGEDAREPGSPHDFGYAILPRMVKRDRVFAYEFNRYWQDIGTIEAYYEANMELLVSQPRYSLDSNWPIFSASSILPVRRTSKDGNIVNSLISPGCVIEGRVKNSILSPGVYVAERATVKNSVVMSDVSIGYHSVVDGCILDERVNIGKLCYIGFGTGILPGNRGKTVVGRDVTVPDCTAIGCKSRVEPGLEPAAFGAQLVPSGTSLVHP